MGLEHELEALRRELAAVSGTRSEDWFPVFKARYGMQVVLEELAEPGPRTGREQEAPGPGPRSDPARVLTQALTCCTAVVPVLAAGMHPVYGDIDPDTLSLAPGAVEPGQRAVVLQHTFGIISPAHDAAVAARARGAGALVIEDSAHCAGRFSRDDHGLELADIALHSFGVQKILPTHFGGAVWISPRLARERPGLDARLRAALGSLEPVGARLSWAARGYRTQVRVLARLPRPVSGPLRAAATRAGALEPAVSEAERRGTLPHRPALPSAWVAARATAALGALPALRQRLAATTAVLREGLDRGGAALPRAVLDGVAQPLLRVPVLVGEADDGARGARADSLIARLRAAGVYAEPWGRPLLYPGVHDPNAYRLPGPGVLAASEEISRRLVALPTDLSPAQVERCLQLVGS